MIVATRVDPSADEDLGELVRLPPRRLVEGASGRVAGGPPTQGASAVHERRRPTVLPRGRGASGTGLAVEAGDA